ASPPGGGAGGPPPPRGPPRGPPRRHRRRPSRDVLIARGMETVEYAAGRLADVFGEPSQPTVLLWHGQQPDARSSVRRLAELIAGHGLGVIAPDWDSYADDGGRADLLDSVHFAHERVDDPEGLVLVGWSMGGVAAAGLTIQAQQFGVQFAHTVCLAGAFMVPDPISGRVPANQLHGV